MQTPLIAGKPLKDYQQRSLEIGTFRDYYVEPSGSKWGAPYDRVVI